MYPKVSGLLPLVKVHTIRMKTTPYHGLTLMKEVKGSPSNGPYILDLKEVKHLMSKKQILGGGGGVSPHCIALHWGGNVFHLIALKNCNDCRLFALMLMGWKQVERGTGGRRLIRNILNN